MRPPSGSKIHRVWQCPVSLALPQVTSDESINAPARARGKLIHKFLERCREIGLEEALAECTDKELLPLLKALDIEALPTHLTTEMAYAYDWKHRTARMLGKLDRHYELADPPLEETEIPMTLDLVGGQVVGGIRRGYTGDYKSGYSRYPAPDKFGQTLIGSLAVSLVHTFDEVVTELIYIHKSGEHHRARRTLDRWALDTFADELEDAFHAVERARESYAAGRGVEAREGPHCDHCPAYYNCPAKVALVKAIPRTLVELDAAASNGHITAADGAAMWVRIEQVEEVLARIKAQICGLAAFDPIPLPDGRVIGVLVTERESLDGPIAAQVIEQVYGVQARDSAIEISVSKDSVRRIASSYKRAGEKISTVKGDGAFDKLMKLIRERGGAGMNRTESVKPHVPRKGKKALGSGG